MTALDNLRRLRYQDPQAAAAVVQALWEQLAREDPRMFAALWRRASRRALRTAEPVVAVPAVSWLDEMPPVTVAPQPMPSFDLRPPLEAPVPLARI